MTNEKKTIFASAEIKELDRSRVEITASVLAADWEKFRAKALKSLNDSVKIDGFRPGKVPENILIAKVGEAAVNEETAELAISRAYVEIIIDKQIDAIGKPEVQVTKLAPGNPLEFKAITAVVPKVALPDYKKIASVELKKKSPDEEKVTDKDVEDAILRVRKQQASHEGHDHAKMTPEEHEKAIMDSLPEFNDEFVRGLGGDFKDVEDFKTKVREMLGQHKKDEAREKMRLKLAEAISNAASVDLPDIMVETELNRTQAQFESDIQQMGVKMEDYLKHSKKTIEDIRKEWRPHAEKKAKLQLILNAIAKEEKLTPDQKEIDQEVDHIVTHYKEADRERASVYAETVLTNEKVFQFLENCK